MGLKLTSHVHGSECALKNMNLCNCARIVIESSEIYPNVGKCLNMRSVLTRKNIGE